MNKVFIFLDSGQTLDAYLNNDITDMIMEEIKNIIIGKEASKTIWLGAEAAELIVPIKNIVAIKIVRNVKEK